MDFFGKNNQKSDCKDYRISDHLDKPRVESECLLAFDLSKVVANIYELIEDEKFDLALASPRFVQEMLDEDDPDAFELLHAIEVIREQVLDEYMVWTVHQQQTLDKWIRDEAEYMDQGSV